MARTIGWSERILLGLIPLSVLIFIPSLGNAFLPKHSITAFGVSLVLLVFFLSGSKILRALPKRLPWIVVAYLAVAVGGLFLARNPGQTAQDLLLQALFLGLFLLVASGGYSADLPRRAAWIVVLCALGVGLLGLAQATLPGHLDFGLQALGKMKTFSTLGNPNYVACFLVLALPLGTHLFLREQGKRRALLGLVGVLSFVCLVLTQSRSGGLAFLFCLGLGAYLKFPRPNVRRGLAAGILLLTASALYVGTATHSGRGRWMVWREAVGIWQAHPILGVGLGNFNNHQLAAQVKFFSDPVTREKFIHNAAFVYDAHNEVLNQMAETGVVGALLWLALVGWVLKRGWRTAQRPGLERAWFLGLSAMLFYGLWNTGLFYAPLGLCFWLGAGFLAGSGASGRGWALRRPLWVSTVLLGLTLLSAGWVLCQVKAGRLEHQGDLLLETGPFDRSSSIFREAVRWDPWDGYLHEKLALSLYFEGKMQEALGPLEKAGRLYGDVGVPYLKAEILAKTGDMKGAAVIFRDIGLAFPSHVTPPFMLGQIYLKLGREEEAKVELQKVLDIPESPYNLKLDRGKVRRQKKLAKEMLASLEGRS